MVSMLTKDVYDIQFKNRKTPVTCPGAFSAIFVVWTMFCDIMNSLLKLLEITHLYKIAIFMSIINS